MLVWRDLDQNDEPVRVTSIVNAYLRDARGDQAVNVLNSLAGGWAFGVYTRARVVEGSVPWTFHAFPLTIAKALEGGATEEIKMTFVNGREQAHSEFTKQLPFAVVATDMSGVYTPVSATENILPKPRSEAGKKIWHSILERTKDPSKRIVPSFLIRPHRRPHLPQVNEPASANNWAGAVMTAQPGAVITSVTATWTVPTVQEAIEQQVPPGAGWQSAAWVGIDGYGDDNDVLQIGTSHSVGSNGGTEYYAWYEWYVYYPDGGITPARAKAFPYLNSVQVTNISVSPGDVITAYVNYIQNDFHVSIAGVVSLVNNTTEMSFSLVLEPPSGASFSGACAEWIMEPPGIIDGNAAPTASFPAFSPVEFNRAIATWNETDAHGKITVASGGPMDASSFDLIAETDASEFVTSVARDSETVVVEFAGASVFGPVASSVGPALALFGGRFFAAWKGAGSDERIFWSSFVPRVGWAAQQVIPGVGTSYGPTLITYGDSLFAAWKGAGKDGGIYWTYFDGATWAPQQRIMGVGTSVGPSLAVFNGEVFAAWKGAKADQGVYYSTFSPAGWAPQQRVPGIGSSTGPSVAAYSDGLYALWTGAVDSKGANELFWSVYDGSNWAPQQRLAGISVARPTLTAFNGKLCAAWIDESEQIWRADFDGASWSAPEKTRILASTSLSLVAGEVLNQHMMLAWKQSSGGLLNPDPNGMRYAFLDSL